MYIRRGRRRAPLRAWRKLMWATRSARSDPTFLLIGAPQSGTTSFFSSYLVRHPGVLPAFVKEVGFFNRNWHEGPDWYRSWFPLRATVSLRSRRIGTRAAVGEGTPGYIYHPHVPGRVASLYPDMRLIALLRDPIDRAYSQYHNARLMSGETLPFEEAIEAEEERVQREFDRVLADPTYFSRPYMQFAYLHKSLYADQLERWLEHFSREQLLVLTTDELKRDRDAVFRRVSQFLELPEWTPAGVEEPARNARSYEPLSPETRDRLAGYFDEPNRRLYALVGRDLGWTRPRSAVP
jgi:hypothetical protein